MDANGHDTLDPPAALATLPPRAPVIGPGHTYASVTDQISAIVLTRRTPRGWLVAFAIASMLVMVLLVSVYEVLARGIGVWGNNVPVGWAFDITNFVWWIG